MKTFELSTAEGRCIARRVHMACGFRARYVGLLLHETMAVEEGLLLIPGGNIHTLGMRFAIDVVFLNRQMRILGFAERVRPWRIRFAPRRTRRVLELAAGQVAAHGLTIGTYLVVDASMSPTDPHERVTVRLPQPCQRQPIQFSLRLPLQRSCSGAVAAPCSNVRGNIDARTPRPDRPAPDSRAETRPSAGT